jgi:hypothetical protein
MNSPLARKRVLLLFGAWLLAVRPALGESAFLCVQLANDAALQSSVPVRLGNTMRLSFRHSIYGSQVEEHFKVRHSGFELFELRYGEARLIEFYGHENSRHENGVVIVAPAPALLSVIHLHPSDDAAMSLYFAPLDDAEPLIIGPGSAYRLTVASCKSDPND